MPRNAALHRAGTLLIAAVALGLVAGCAGMVPSPKAGGGAKPAAAGAGPAAGGAAQSGMKPWAEATKGMDKLEGFITLYRKPDALMAEIRKDQLGKEFLGVFTLSRGIGTAFVLGGLPLSDRLLAWERHGNELYLMHRNELFTAPKGSAYEKAKDLSMGHSVLATAKIVSERDSGAAMLVDMAALVLSDMADLSTYASGISQGATPAPARFEKSRSVLEGVKNFPKNTEIEALLTYAPGGRPAPGMIAVPDPRWVPIGVHYSFVALPETPMQPRRADDRVGYFLAVTKDFSRDDQEDFFVRYVNRWRLEKKDPAAALSEPVQPIVYYIDRTVPEQYRPWVKQGIEKWQKAYEAAGFKNAIIAKDAPTEEEDPDWDAEDVRYSTIRWITSAGNSFNAIGPSRVDPRTGEILDADVLVEALAMQGYRTTWRKYAGPTDLAADILALPPAGLPVSAEHLCENQASAMLDGGLMRAALLLGDVMPPGSPVPDEYMEPFVVRLIMHEVGHTLGLRHNFRSSAATPYDRLHDVDWTSRNGLMGSVMDYVTPNISPDRSKQGEYFISTAGTYDLWAIRFGYASSGYADIAADAGFARDIAEESTLPGHDYATDWDASAPNALDPRSERWDLSDDPLRWAAERTAYVRGLWRDERFESRIIGEDGDFPVLTRAMDTLLALYGRTAIYAVRYVGGQYHHADHRGQKGGKDPLTPIPAARQREAMAVLAADVFDPAAFDVAPALLNRLAPDRWAHWGLPPAFAPDARVDYDYSGRVLAVQGAMLNALLEGGLLARLNEAQNRSANPYTLKEHFSRMTTAIWGEVDGARTAAFNRLEGPAPRRDLQRMYVDVLASVMLDAPGLTPEDARSQARLELTRIDARAARALAIGDLGDYTRAHLMESRARIARALDAKRMVEG
jgi:hypothetical protein